jgi:hypothetical protein
MGPTDHTRFMDRVRKGFTDCKVTELGPERLIGVCQVAIV